MRGLIVKGIAGFYYVKTELGIIEAKGRGIFKKDGNSLLVGDEVDISIIDRENLKGVIEKIHPRKNSFARPPISNIDVFVLVIACKKPKPNYAVIDKFLVNSEFRNTETIICINKADLVGPEEINRIKSIYDKAYKVVILSTKTKEGIKELESLIKDKKTVLSGPSGVGKSSILNLLNPSAEMEVGQISEKTSRGKHTTRHVEIFETSGGGLVFDTPGFTSFDIPEEVDADELNKYYPEFEEYLGKCQYDNCKHIKEPGCAVLKGLDLGKIKLERYNSYISNYEELKKRKKY